jgi:hypothetical protein
MTSGRWLPAIFVTGPVVVLLAQPHGTVLFVCPLVAVSGVVTTVGMLVSGALPSAWVVGRPGISGARFYDDQLREEARRP